MRRALFLGILLYGLPASAQTVIAYDDIQADTSAAITCGFCATEKFGTVFYELPGGGGLTANAFPLTLNKIQIAVASTQVGDFTTGYMCTGTTQGGRVDATLEVYAGTTVPATITNLPATGAWPGEMVVVAPGTVSLERSVATAMGSTNFNVMINDLMVGAMVPSPNTYLRVVVTVPGGGMSGACTDLGFTPPALSPFRDDNGRVAPRRGFIYQLGLPAPFNTPSQWTWAEDVSDPVTMQRGINGDWLIRLDITPSGVIPTDAGVAEDAGPSVVDTGVQMDAAAPDAAAEDAGVTPTPDAGVVADPPSISAISPDTVAQGSSVSVTVTGTGFVEGLSLKVGAIPAEVKLIGGSSTIVAEVPMGIAAGLYDVVVTNPDGQSAILPDGFTVMGSGGGSTPVANDGCRCLTPRGPPAFAAFVVVLGLGFARRRRN